jgi:hypothetical protein
MIYCHFMDIGWTECRSHALCKQLCRSKNENMTDSLTTASQILWLQNHKDDSWMRNERNGCVINTFGGWWCRTSRIPLWGNTLTRSSNQSTDRDVLPIFLWFWVPLSSDQSINRSDWMDLRGYRSNGRVITIALSNDQSNKLSTE